MLVKTVQKYYFSSTYSFISSEIAQKGKPAATPVGHYRLEVCLSDDHQFCALQLFRFADFQNAPVTEPLFYEGKDVETVAQLL